MSTSAAASLANKVAIITGGSKGIGRATALRLAREGARVIIGYSGDVAAAEDTVKTIGSENAVAIKGDAGKLDDISKLVDATVQKFGKIDIVVANAGLMRLNDLDEITEEDFDVTFSLNVKGPIFLAQKAAPHMKAGGRIITFSTTQTAASTVTPNYLTYIASKGAVEQATRALSKALAPRGILVNAVAPGPTGTDLFLKGKSEQLLKTLAGFNPQNRIGEPEEIAEIVAFLASEKSSWVSGQVLRANGGMA